MERRGGEEGIGESGSGFGSLGKGGRGEVVGVVGLGLEALGRGERVGGRQKDEEEQEEWEQTEVTSHGAVKDTRTGVLGGDGKSWIMAVRGVCRLSIHNLRS